MLDAAVLCEDAKKEALGSGLLSQLRSSTSENLAVLTGRRAGNFTDRTNQCIWYALLPESYLVHASMHALLHVWHLRPACLNCAMNTLEPVRDRVHKAETSVNHRRHWCRFANMSLACLERLTAADADNCLSLVTSSVSEFTQGKRIGFPAVVLACVQLVRSEQLMQNRSTQICVEECLHLLMNLTHSGTGSAIVAEHRGIESLTEIVWNLSTSSPKSTSASESTKSAKVAPISSSEGEPTIPLVCLHLSVVLGARVKLLFMLRGAVRMLCAC